MAGVKKPMIVLEYSEGKGRGITAKQYQDQVLEKVLLGFQKEQKGKNGMVLFQQDGAPSYRAKTTKQWLEAAHIPLPFYPPSFSNLNLIEALWYVPKAILHRLPCRPTSIKTLIAAVHSAQDAIPIEEVNRLVNQMPEHVRAVLKAKGGHTGF